VGTLAYTGFLPIRYGHALPKDNPMAYVGQPPTRILPKSGGSFLDEESHEGVNTRRLGLSVGIDNRRAIRERDEGSFEGPQGRLRPGILGRRDTLASMDAIDALPKPDRYRP
jgi:hypothetical protein